MYKRRKENRTGNGNFRTENGNFLTKRGKKRTENGNFGTEKRKETRWGNQRARGRERWEIRGEFPKNEE